jgi:hypothetical protein
VGGVLSIVLGGLAALIGLILLLLAIGNGISQGWYHATAPLGTFFFFGGWLLATGGAAIAGGISATRRKNWPLALTGAIFSIFTGFTVVGMVAVVLIAVSKKDFP